MQTLEMTFKENSRLLSYALDAYIQKMDSHLKGEGEIPEYIKAITSKEKSDAIKLRSIINNYNR